MNNSLRFSRMLNLDDLVVAIFDRTESQLQNTVACNFLPATASDIARIARCVNANSMQSVILYHQTKDNIISSTSDLCRLQILYLSMRYTVAYEYIVDDFGNKVEPPELDRLASIVVPRHAENLFSLLLDSQLNWSSSCVTIICTLDRQMQDMEEVAKKLELFIDSDTYDLNFIRQIGNCLSKYDLAIYMCDFGNFISVLGKRDGDVVVKLQKIIDDLS